MRYLLGFAGLWAAVAGANGATLPFTIDTQDGQWKAVSVQKVVAPDVTFDTVISHVNGTERLIVFRSPAKADGPDSLTTFARHLKDSFTAYHSSSEGTEQAGEKLGYRGRDLTFDMVNEKGAFDCELFVFANEQTWWGVLHAKSKSAPASSTSAFSLLHKIDAPPADVIKLDSIRIKDTPLSKFPISIDVLRSLGSNRVSEITVSDVHAGSAAERDGIRVGDKIISVNSRKTQDFAVGVGKDSELGRIFLNRDPGDEVKLELVSAESKKPYAVTLRVPSIVPGMVSTTREQ